MKELILAHEAKRLADSINNKTLDDIKAAITGEIMNTVNKGQYKTFIFFEHNFHEYRGEIIEWLESKGYKVKYDPGNPLDGPRLDISWEEL